MPGHGAHDAPDPAMMALYAAMPPEKRLEVVDRLTHSVRNLAAVGVRLAHPDWTDNQVTLEAARRLLNGNN